MPPEDLPDELEAFPADGWGLDGPMHESNPIQIGMLWVPWHFHVVVNHKTDPWSVTLLFRVDNEEVVLAGAWGSGSELPELLDLIRSYRPLQWWKRWTLLRVVADLTERATDLMVSGDVDAFTENQNRGLRSVPLNRRRNRITHQHLQEVAEVYRGAWDAGAPPTQAVANHFAVSHSTAAHYVSRAREAGVLRPAKNSRGGEIE